jgi:hypothetical protein
VCLRTFLTAEVQKLGIINADSNKMVPQYTHKTKHAMNILMSLFPGHLILKFGDLKWQANCPDITALEFSRLITYS